MSEGQRGVPKAEPSGKYRMTVRGEMGDDTAQIGADRIEHGRVGRARPRRDLLSSFLFELLFNSNNRGVTER